MNDPRPSEEARKEGVRAATSVVLACLVWFVAFGVAVLGAIGLIVWRALK